MITDSDIKKLAQVFATKDDLQQMEAGIRQDMATKDDLERFATKDDVREIIDERMEGIVKGVRTIIDMLGETNSKTEQNTDEVRGHRIAIGDHEARLQALKKALA